MKADLELVDEVRKGNRPAFSELVRRHHKGLLRLILRMVQDLEVAEDVVQDSFMKAFEKIHLFEGRSAFKSWLYQIAINTARNSFRTVRNENVELEKVHVSISAVAETDLVKRDVRFALQKEIDKLPERQKVALTLRIYEDMSFKEIAQIMDCPYDTAKANFRHAFLKIQESVQSNELFNDWKEDDEGEVDVSDGYLEVDP